MNARRHGAGGCAASNVGNGANAGYPCPPCYFGVTATRATHSSPVLSFRQPKESLVRLKELGGKVAGGVGQVVDKVRQKWDARQAHKKQNPPGGRGKVGRKQNKAQGNEGGCNVAALRVERGLFRHAPTGAGPLGDDEEEECAAGQDLHHLHEHHQGGKATGSGKVSSPLNTAGVEEETGPALFVLGRTQSFDTALLREAEARSHHRRGPLSYGNGLVDFVGFALKLLALLLFQVLGTALVVNDYQTTGLVSQTLIRFASLLAGLAFVPPLVVALRESLPSHARNPLVRGLAHLFELALDVVVVAALSLLASVLLTAVISLPSYNFLLSRELGEEYIKGALSAGFVMFFLYAFGKNFEPLASKWFM